MSDHIILLLDDLTPFSPLPLSRAELPSASQSLRSLESGVESSIGMQDTLDDNICSISEAQDGNGNNEITSPEARTRWYLRHDEQSKNAFTEEDTHTDQTRLITLIADQEVQPAVTITAKTDYIRAVFPTWVTQDRYCDLVLGVCTKNLDVDAIEAIVISFTASNVGDDKKSYSEVISTSELRRLVDIESKKHLQIVKAEQEQSEKRTNLYSIDADDGHIWKWKLHKKVSPITLYLEIVIEIRTWDYIGYNYCNNGSELDDGDVSCGGGSYENRSSNDDYGVLELHFIEILEDAQYYYSQSPSYIEHRPFLRSVDLNRTGYKDLDSITDDPQTVTDYAISKDGSHIVVTTVAGKEGNERRFIQLWNFQDSSSLSSSVASLPLTLKSSPQDIGSGPQLVAWMQLSETEKWCSSLLLSWDGSQLVVLDMVPLKLSMSERKKYRTNTTFFRVDRSIMDSGLRLIKCRVEDRHSRLRGFCGVGHFHMITATDQNAISEMFLTYDGAEIDIYTVDGDWRHVQSIAINSVRNNPKAIVDIPITFPNQCRSQYLVLEVPNCPGQVATWDIQLGSVISSFTGLTSEQLNSIGNSTAMSSDGRLIAIPGSRHVDLFWTETWTLVGKFEFKSMDWSGRIKNVQFIREDSHIMVSVRTIPGKNSIHHQTYGYILDVETIALVEQVIIRESEVFLLTKDDLTNPQIVCVIDSQVSFSHLETRIIRSPSRIRELCDTYCNSVALFKDISQKERVPSMSPLLSSKGIHRVSGKLENVRITFNGHHKKLTFIVITVWNDHSNNIILQMSVPLPKSMQFQFVKVMGEEELPLLMVALDRLLMIWRMPRIPEERCVFYLAHNVEFKVQWRVCSHNRLYRLRALGDKDDNNYHLHDGEDYEIDDCSLLDSAQNGRSQEFLNGVITLIEIFEFASDNLRQDILLYVGKHINRYSWSPFYSGNLVSYICKRWTPERHSAMLLFLNGLLLNPVSSVRWVPQTQRIQAIEDYNENPVFYLLNKARAEPKMIDLAQILVEYFICRARKEKDPYFLVYIIQCHQGLMVTNDKTDNSLPYPIIIEEFVTQFYRELAYLPARPIRLPNDAKEQEQELQWNGIRAGLIPRKDLSSKELYYASFDMMWYSRHRTGLHVPSNKQENKSRIISKMKNLWSILKHRINPQTRNSVEIYPMVFQSYDNPALIALIDYKWNAIGLAYWRFHFIWQCLYYLTVLIGVALQIYGKSKIGIEGYIVYGWAGVFFDMLTTTFIFLCAEIILVFRLGVAYFKSFFRIMDFLVLAFPFAGSINQLCTLFGLVSPFGQNSGLLSFSVLIVLLHFVYELRIFKPIAQVVSSINRSMESIAAFLAVYLIGVLGFLMAFIHMIPACSDAASCQNPASVGIFPSDFFMVMSGISLSGRKGWGTGGFYSDNWAYFILAFLFFLFNVIICINMIVYLVYNATKPGAQETWRRDWFLYRLEFITKIENKAYKKIDGRSDPKNYPDVVFYSAEPKNVKKYEKETKLFKAEMSWVHIDQSSENDKVRRFLKGRISGGLCNMVRVKDDQYQSRKE